MKNQFRRFSVNKYLEWVERYYGIEARNVCEENQMSHGADGEGSPWPWLCDGHLVQHNAMVGDDGREYYTGENWTVLTDTAPVVDFYGNEIEAEVVSNRDADFAYIHLDRGPQLPLLNKACVVRLYRGQYHLVSDDVSFAINVPEVDQEEATQ